MTDIDPNYEFINAPKRVDFGKIMRGEESESEEESSNIFVRVEEDETSNIFERSLRNYPHLPQTEFKPTVPHSPNLLTSQ